ncbi:MAG: ABC transporter substrate-binding protein, partial [Eubacteriales bacterium]|nr:ABC transporter substrate-binding protein [Eubacteriales bacterium]
MKRTLALLLALLLILSLASAQAQDATYTTLYSGEVTTLNYLTTATTNEFAVAANVIDTLVEYDRLGQVQPSLAESWEVSEDGLTWTFHLRRGAQWVNGAGEPYAEVKADDFVAAAEYILNAANASSTADIIYSVVEGAEAYYQGTAAPEEGEEPAPVMPWETVGIKALDDYTLEYRLNSPIPYFLSMTTYVCFMPVNRQFLEEKGAGFGLATGNDTILYNGAYVLSEFKPQEKRIYTKNAANWDAGNVLIETIEQLYNKEATTLSPELYQRGEIDEASIDSAIANEWLSNPETADLIRPVRQSGFYSYFYALNFKPEFDAAYEPENWKIAVNNENFRQSIYYGLDRVKAMMCIEPDQPESIIFNTITPPEFVSIDGLDYTQMGALAEITALGTDTFNEETALSYKEAAVKELTEAGATFPIKILMPYNPS